MELIAQKFDEKSQEMQEIQSWQDHPNMGNINKFLLRNNDKDTYKETFVNYISNKLNVDKTLKTQNVAICYKDPTSHNEIAGFVLISAFRVNKLKNNKLCYIEAICINPDYPSGMGIGRYMLYDILENSNKYLKKFVPDYFSANIANDNIASITMFKHAGFDINQEKTNIHAFKFTQKEDYLENN